MLIYGKSLPIAFEGVSFFFYTFLIAWNYGMVFFFPVLLILFVLYFIKSFLGIFWEGIRYSLWHFRSVFSILFLILFSALWLLIQFSTLEPMVKNIKIDLKNVHGRQLKIIQISDTHIGNIVNQKSLNKIAQKINSLDGDVLVLTGDIIDNNNDFIPIFEEFYKKIRPFPGGVFAIIGNHDHIDSAEPLIKSYEELGITLLNNSSVTIRDRIGKTWQIAGMDYPYPHFRDPIKRKEMLTRFFKDAFSTITLNDPVILLNHDPKNSDYLAKKAQESKKRIDLILAGHTHGSQICIPSFIQFLENNINPFIRGHYIIPLNELETNLYINSGTGHWMPLRINCPPEITRLIVK